MVARGRVRPRHPCSHSHPGVLSAIGTASFWPSLTWRHQQVGDSRSFTLFITNQLYWKKKPICAQTQCARPWHSWLAGHRAVGSLPSGLGLGGPQREVSRMAVSWPPWALLQFHPDEHLYLWPSLFCPPWPTPAPALQRLHRSKALSVCLSVCPADDSPRNPACPHPVFPK